MRRRGTGRRWAAGTVMAVLCVLTVGTGPVAVAAGAATASDAIEVVALSNRADLVSGDDVLIEVRLPAEVAVDDIRVDVDGRDVTDAFAMRRDGRFAGLVEGLQLGVNVVTATVGTGSSAPGARLEVTNHPIGGPIFSGPQIQPWYCLPDAVDEQCNRPTDHAYHYWSMDNDGFQPYDVENPPSDVATTTTDDGTTVPYIVRVETGVMDRGQYRIAVLADPDQAWTRWTGPAGWNHKVWALHGAGCSTSHVEAVAQDVLKDMALSRGFAVLASGLADNTYSCNLVVQAESMMMAKEHLVERYGDIRYLFGVGCSGGSIASLTMANAYPGIYDGLVVGCTMPDVPINDLLDCATLLRYWNDPTRWDPGVVWTEVQQAAASGFASTSVCHAWVEAFHYPELFQPRTGVGCRIPDHEPERVYDPDTNPGGIRCSWQDHLANVLGMRPPDRWGEVERGLGFGFAGRPYDNVGVAYGLRALLAGDISPAQFVDLNAKVGSLNIDYDHQTERVEADPDAIVNAYRGGVVNEGHHLARIPIIDLPGTVPGDRYEIHDNTKSWSLRERLLAANGTHDNHVLWYGPDESAPLRNGNNIVGDGQAFLAMDEWLTAVEADDRDVPTSRKVLDNRPDEATDRCGLPDPATCAEVFGPAGNARHGAGQLTVANDVVKCALEPLSEGVFEPVTFTDAQWAILQATFPDGICDWSQPGVGQQAAVTWQTYAAGPGGKAMGGAPVSEPFGGGGTTAPDAGTPLPATGGGLAGLATVLAAAGLRIRKLRGRP